jgi:hypothetical protein
MRLRSHFAALVVGAVVPVLIVALVLVALHNRSLWLIGGGGFLILLGVTALWLAVGRRVARPIRSSQQTRRTCSRRSTIRAAGSPASWLWSPT